MTDLSEIPSVWHATTHEWLHEERVPSLHPCARRLPAGEGQRQRESDRENWVARDVEEDVGDVGHHIELYDVDSSEKSGRYGEVREVIVIFGFGRISVTGFSSRSLHSSLAGKAQSHNVQV